MGGEWIEAIGYAGTAATVATYSMRTIIPLRIAGILSSLFFITYAVISGVLPMLVTELIILPINCYRLYQILRPAPQTPVSEPLTTGICPLCPGNSANPTEGSLRHRNRRTDKCAASFWRPSSSPHHSSSVPSRLWRHGPLKLVAQVNQLTSQIE